MMEDNWCPVEGIMCANFAGHLIDPGNAMCGAMATTVISIVGFERCPFPRLQKKLVRYPMCEDQNAQVDCRKDWCSFWRNGKCKNISPAITLNQDGTYRCWSYEEK